MIVSQINFAALVLAVWYSTGNGNGGCITHGGPYKYDEPNENNWYGGKYILLDKIYGQQRGNTWQGGQNDDLRHAEDS